jgi:cytochrome b subunit of formate dehydrogenase
MKIPMIVRIVTLLSWVGLFFAQVFIETRGPAAGEKNLRWFWMLAGLVCLFTGAVLLYYAPPMGVLRSEARARLGGILLIFFGCMALVISRGSVRKMYEEFKRHTTDRRIVPHYDRYVSPRERVFGKSEDEKEPWE